MAFKACALIFEMGFYWYEADWIGITAQTEQMTAKWIKKKKKQYVEILWSFSLRFLSQWCNLHLPLSYTESDNQIPQHSFILILYHLYSATTATQVLLGNEWEWICTTNIMQLIHHNSCKTVSSFIPTVCLGDLFWHSVTHQVRPPARSTVLRHTLLPL